MSGFNWGALLAGLGGAAESAGTSLAQERLLALQQKQQDAERKRQQAKDALDQLISLNKIGGSIAPPGTTPQEAALNASTAVSPATTIRLSDTGGGLVPTAGASLTRAPVDRANVQQIPDAVTGELRTVTIDPTQSDSARAVEREHLKQMAMLERQSQLQTAEDAAKAQRASQAEASRNALADAAQARTARADYNTLRLAFPKHPLAQAPFDPQTNYSKAIDDARQLRQIEVGNNRAQLVDVETVNPDGTKRIVKAWAVPGQRTLTPTEIGSAKQPGAGSLTGQTMQTMGRMGTSYNDLKQTIEQMEQYENDPQNLAKITPIKQAMGVAAETHPASEAHGFLSGLNNTAGAWVSGKAQQQLNDEDPAYRTYLNNKQRVATAFTELLPRPNQALLQLEKGLSGADVGWNPALISNIQARRRGGLDVLKNILSQQGMLDANGNVTGTRGGGGAGAGSAAQGGGVPPLTRKAAADRWDALVKAGMAPDDATKQVAKEFKIP